MNINTVTNEVNAEGNEIVSNSQFEQFVIEFGVRFHNCQNFTVNDLLNHLPSANKIKVGYMLEDLAIKGTVKKSGQSFYFIPDNRELKTKVMEMFGNQYIFYTIDQLSRTLKQRSDHVKEAVNELVKDGKLVACPFIGGSWWLAQ